MECFVSLSWILYGAFYKVLYKEGYLMLQILLKNISKEYLFEEHIFRESLLINVEVIAWVKQTKPMYV